MRMTSPLEVGVAAREIEVLVRFYADALGCTEAMRTEIPDVITQPAGLATGVLTFVWLQTPNGERIKILGPATESAEPGTTLSTRTGISYLTFYVDSIDETLDAAVRAGATVISDPAPVTAGPGVQIVFLRDPEGNAFELVQNDSL